MSEQCCSGSSCCCDTGSGNGGMYRKKLLVEYLFLDLHTCDRCVGAAGPCVCADDESSFELPENLRRFYAGKKR